jgi:lambda repressor-like predicted transcriptional regulator
MKAIEIRIALLQKGYSYARLARELGKAQSTISNVINDHGRSRVVAERVSRITGHPIDQLWPRSYSAARHTKGSRRAA